MRKELTCISCPIGCALVAETQADGSVSVTGNQCSRGVEYAHDELVDPKRVVTATCRTNSTRHARLPVRSREPCPREKIAGVLQRIYGLTAEVPVSQGDLLAELDGVQIVATRTLED